MREVGASARLFAAPRSITRVCPDGPGASVLVEELPDGELRIPPTDTVRQRVRGIADRVVREHPEAMDILAEQAPDDRR